MADINVFSDYGWVKGLNVIPSWAARVEEIWWNYDPERFRYEISLMKKMQANTARLWLEFSPWMSEPEKTKSNLADAVNALDEIGIRSIICLFNRWHDVLWDFGGTYRENLNRRGFPSRIEYVTDIVSDYVDDERILMWDLCNEPQAVRGKSRLEKSEFEWLMVMSDTVRRCGVRQPVTIGTHNAGNCKNMELYAPLVDVLTCHSYALDKEELGTFVKKYQRIQKKFNKPMICTEATRGCRDDMQRAAVAKLEYTALVAAGFGWMGWSILPGKAVATRLDRMDPNGISEQGYHPWFMADGTPRNGLDWLMR